MSSFARRLAPAARGVSVAAVVWLSGLDLAGCAEAECKFNSDCAAGLCIDGTCERQCVAPVDCPKDRPVCLRGVCNASSADAGADASIDSDVGKDATPVDSGTPDVTLDDTTEPADTTTPVDTSVPPTDTAGGTKGYLTACASDGECASGKCTTSAPRFCTKTCSASGDCAHSQICAGGVCRVDDTGTSCSSGSACLQFCVGTTTTVGHCTHGCSTGADCPAGYACSVDSVGTKICVDIERPCTDAIQCPGGLGFCTSGGVGCTAKCTSASDCPQRLVGLPAYTCEARGGQNVCIPPSDVLGSAPLGATCSSTGTNLCRSGACDDGTSPATCAQRCSLRGGCPVSWGCYPLEDPGPPKSTMLICSPAGSLWLGSSCSRGRDCLSGICQAPGYCTRQCADGYCPDGMSCVASGLTATDGTPVKLCSKP